MNGAIPISTPAPGGSLSPARRERELARLAGGEIVDLLVVGGGVTGAGVALDAASRGLSVALVEARDLAWGTSRWSSKLVHGGLRYLASGDLGLAMESATERDILLRRTAPHLVHPVPIMVPLTPAVRRTDAVAMTAGLRVADGLRRAARTPSGTLPPPRRLTAVEAHQLAPTLRETGLRGGLLYWDGQLVDDARLVVAIARTAAAYGARVLTRLRARTLDGTGALVEDTLTGSTFSLRARAVVNATGVWAPTLAPEVRLRPSRGTHLVVAAGAFGGTRTALTVPMPGQRNRYALVLPQDDDRVYVGLTDVPADTVEDVPRPTAAEVEELLGIVSGVLDAPLDRADMLGTFAGLRPLLDVADTAGATGRTAASLVHSVTHPLRGRAPSANARSAPALPRSPRSADLSRRHAVLVGPGGVVTVVGGKLTTYRRMARDAVDLAVAHAGLAAGACRTARLPLVGAAPRAQLAAVDAPRRLVERYGTEAPAVLAEAGGDPDLLAPVAAGMSVTGAELLFALRHEGALDVDDLLDRRTRIGLVAADRAAAAPRAARLVDLVAGDRV
ncbi:MULTISPECIES: glycerol-3-phosphate dehydrogenase/oxidase [unclassified Pseudofrankia]|uniref:glycerol-3-phosphate dehydrogenase/oxidase n=1 Tax=unclassified Pseudofrankia TaxID=2994372 RepID=UPI0008DA11CE|nr:MULTISPECIES: glycerol-3-phosphate dehydrogenase/oxidase [unclassified Pseudofrankia]MDT3438770.1 glycerol-3-phosphate dehydrogenase/oxidase [Pseudofrankia sp. BMG5.37]OHV73032.1 glycerol-3-phosphate dehydrogenase [Pseudofrankia sp. BMG5.36]